MKKILFATALATIFIFPSYGIAQDPRCEGLKADLAVAEKKLIDFQKAKIPMEDFFSLMEEPVKTAGPINEEISLSSQAIQNLQAKIAGGDNSAETAAWLQSYKDRVELMKLRISPNYSENTFYKLPKYLALQKKMNSMGNDELDMKRDTASIGLQLVTLNCPRAKKESDDLGDISTDLEGFGGKWKSADPRNTGITLTLNGSGSSTTGSMVIPAGALQLSYQVKECSDNGNSLSCKFTTVMEDYEKFVDVTGSVQLTLTNTGLSSSWRENSLNVRWKPGNQRDVQQRPLKTFELPFKR